MSQIDTLRRAFWHLRKGGVPQLRLWYGRHAAATGVTAIHAPSIQAAGRSVKAAAAPVFNAFDYPGLDPRRADLRVGVILDDFSFSAFRYEWDQVELSRSAWRQQLDGLDLVFVESAWNGNHGQWKYQLTGTSGVKDDFKDLLAACRDAGIPTVFWNKEDPVHFDDFIEAATMFDSVFTTDANRIDSYRETLGHDRVGVLPFAAQPAIHHPVRPVHGFHKRGVAFGGMYFAHKYPERRAQMDFLLGGAADVSASTKGLSFEIFSRQLGGELQYQFPEGLSKYVVGGLSYDQMLTAYRAYKVFLNVNSVVDSPSMCARRIFEITASGTPVVSAPSEAIGEFFASDEVFVADDRAQATAQIKLLGLNEELRSRTVHKAQRKIWSQHTYAHRVESVLAVAAPARVRPVRLPSVSAMVSTIRPQQLERVFETVARQRGVDTELVLLTHGFEVPARQIRKLSRRHGLSNVVHLTAGRDVSLGECLNSCVSAASGEVLTKMDDDDFYGAEYLGDLLHAMKYSRADVVGKQAHYMYFASRDLTVLRTGHMEHRFTRMVMGPTITARAEVLRVSDGLCEGRCS
ncbi:MULTISPECIES: glycosyltransferase [Arthrobacter]|uniref:Glycosyltransferase n=2 Tax=Arthrobacter TaxID=1663 RepID=A0ABU9KQH8_9MICC|nr:glycosyltransferase [Arthrobacter sp. YJM1]MDP5228553.1 glycosyltransferase [Arthrobacter sp. YJM1]